MHKDHKEKVISRERVQSDPKNLCTLREMAPNNKKKNYNHFSYNELPGNFFLQL